MKLQLNHKKKIDSEDVEPSDLPEDEGAKSATDSSPTEVIDNLEKEREELAIPT